MFMKAQKQDLQNFKIGTAWVRVFSAQIACDGDEFLASPLPKYCLWMCQSSAGPHGCTRLHTGRTKKHGKTTKGFFSIPRSNHETPGYARMGVVLCCDCEEVRARSCRGAAAT